MTALEKQAQAAGIQYKVISEDREREIQVIEVNGVRYEMSTHWRTYGKLNNGGSIFRILSSIANIKKKSSKSQSNQL